MMGTNESAARSGRLQGFLPSTASVRALAIIIVFMAFAFEASLLASGGRAADDTTLARIIALAARLRQGDLGALLQTGASGGHGLPFWAVSSSIAALFNTQPDQTLVLLQIASLGCKYAAFLLLFDLLADRKPAAAALFLGLMLVTPAFWLSNLTLSGPYLALLLVAAAMHREYRLRAGFVSGFFWALAVVVNPPVAPLLLIPLWFTLRDYQGQSPVVWRIAGALVAVAIGLLALLDPAGRQATLADASWPLSFSMQHLQAWLGTGTHASLFGLFAPVAGLAVLALLALPGLLPIPQRLAIRHPVSLLILSAASAALVLLTSQPDAGAMMAAWMVMVFAASALAGSYAPRLPLVATGGALLVIIGFAALNGAQIESAINQTARHAAPPAR